VFCRKNQGTFEQQCNVPGMRITEFLALFNFLSEHKIPTLIDEFQYCNGFAGTLKVLIESTPLKLSFFRQIILFGSHQTLVKEEGTDTLYHVNYICNTPAFPRPPPPLTYNMLKETQGEEKLIQRWLDAIVRFDGDLSGFTRLMKNLPIISTSCDFLDLLHKEHRSVLESVAQSKLVKNPDNNILLYIYCDLEKFGYVKKLCPILSNKRKEIKWQVANPTLLLIHTTLSKSPINQETLEGYALEYIWKDLLALPEVQKMVFCNMNFEEFQIIDGYWADSTETEIDLLAFATTTQNQKVLIVGSSKRSAKVQEFYSSLLRHLVRFFHAEKHRLSYLDYLIIPIALNFLPPNDLGKVCTWPDTPEDALNHWQQIVNDENKYKGCFGDYLKRCVKEENNYFKEQWTDIKSRQTTWGTPVQVYLEKVLSFTAKDYQMIKNPSVLKRLAQEYN